MLLLTVGPLGSARAQTLPVSDPIHASGSEIIQSQGRLYFGTAERAYEYDPAASSATGRGLTRALAPVSADWSTFQRTGGNAFLPISGGTRDGRECFRGMRRYQPAGDDLLFSTKACLLPNEFPAVLAGADNFFVAGGRLYYTRHGILYSTDGSATGNRQELPVRFGHTPFTRIDNRVIFAGGDSAGSFSFYEIGPQGGVRWLGSTNVQPEGSIVQLGNVLYAIGSDPTYGRELYRHDLTSRLTTIVTDLTPGPDGSKLGGLTVFKGALYLHADGLVGDELYRVDASGLTLVRDIHPTGSATPRDLTAGTGKLYFRADDGVLGEELWETDGTEAGTRLAVDFYPGRGSSRLHDLTMLGTTLYTWANEGLWGESLYRLREGKFELVETTSLMEPVYLNGRIDDWPQRFDERTIRDAAGDVEVGDPVDFVSAKIAASGGGLLIGYEVTAPRGEIARHHVFFDVDHRAESGWRIFYGPIGADYMLEGITFYRYTGDGGSWVWERIADARYYSSLSGVEIALGTPALGTGIIGSKVMLMGTNLKRTDWAYFERQ